MWIERKKATNKRQSAGKQKCLNYFGQLSRASKLSKKKTWDVFDKQIYMGKIGQKITSVIALFAVWKQVWE